MLTQAEADAIVDQAPLEGRGAVSPRTLWAWAQCYVDGPDGESTLDAVSRVLSNYDAVSLANVLWKLDGWPGFRPRTLAYELLCAKQGDAKGAAMWRAKRMSDPATPTD